MFLFYIFQKLIKFFFRRAFIFMFYETRFKNTFINKLPESTCYIFQIIIFLWINFTLFSLLSNKNNNQRIYAYRRVIIFFNNYIKRCYILLLNILLYNIQTKNQRIYAYNWCYFLWPNILWYNILGKNKSTRDDKKEITATLNVVYIIIYKIEHLDSVRIITRIV